MAEEKEPQFVEDDDVARAKAFWKENGKSIVAGIAIGLSGIVGFNYWQSYEQYQGESASELYDQIRPGVDAINAMTVAEELKEEFSSSVYASLGAFTLAKIFVEEGKPDLAAVELQWVLETTGNSGMRHIARVRLASVYLSMENPQQVLELLDGVDGESFSSRYHELMGDAYALRASNGDSGKARTEYQQSMEQLPDYAGQSGLIRLKMENLGDS